MQNLLRACICSSLDISSHHCVTGIKQACNASQVVDHYENPRNVGSFGKNDADVGTGLVGAPACGDVMKLQIKVLSKLVNAILMIAWMTDPCTCRMMVAIMICPDSSPCVIHIDAVSHIPRGKW